MGRTDYSYSPDVYGKPWDRADSQGDSFTTTMESSPRLHRAAGARVGGRFQDVRPVPVKTVSPSDASVYDRPGYKAVHPGRLDAVPERRLCKVGEEIMNPREKVLNWKNDITTAPEMLCSWSEADIETSCELTGGDGAQIRKNPERGEKQKSRDKIDALPTSSAEADILVLYAGIQELDSVNERNLKFAEKLYDFKVQQLSASHAAEIAQLQKEKDVQAGLVKAYSTGFNQVAELLENSRKISASIGLKLKEELLKSGTAQHNPRKTGSQPAGSDGGSKNSFDPERSASSQKGSVLSRNDAPHHADGGRSSDISFDVEKIVPAGSPVVKPSDERDVEQRVKEQATPVSSHVVSMFDPEALIDMNSPEQFRFHLEKKQNEGAYNDSDFMKKFLVHLWGKNGNEMLGGMVKDVSEQYFKIHGNMPSFKFMGDFFGYISMQPPEYDEKVLTEYAELRSGNRVGIIPPVPPATFVVMLKDTNMDPVTNPKLFWAVGAEHYLTWHTTTSHYIHQLLFGGSHKK